MANHQNAATLGVALSLETGDFVTQANKVAYETQKMKNAIAREMKAADKEIQALKYATEDYGKAVTKVSEIERQLATGRLKDIKGTDKAKELLAQAAAYDKVAAAAKNAMGAQFKMNEQQKIQLTYQTTDLFTQIASGQSPFIAILQQGGQLKDVMGGIGPMFRAIGTLFTPFSVGLTSVAVAFGATAFAAYEANKEFDKFEDSLTLTGKFAGVAADKLIEMSKSVAESTKTTIGNAIGVLDTLVASGKYTSTSLEAVSKAILLYSKIAGVDGKQAAEALMSGLDGTASGAKTLNDKMNFLTLAQYKQIEALEQAGKKQEAAKLAADILSGRMDAQKRILGDYEIAWDNATKAMSRFWASFKEAIAGPSTSEGMLKKVNSEIEALEFALKKSTAPEKYKVAEKERLEILRQQRGELEKTILLAKASEVNPEEKGGIGAYATAGGAKKEIEIKSAIAKAIANNEFLIAAEGANEIQKIELEAAKELEEKRLEFSKKSAEEKLAFGGLLARQLDAEIYTIELKRDEKIKSIRAKNRLSEYEEYLRTQKEITDAEVAESNRLAGIRTANQSKTREMEYQKESLDLKYQMIYATQKEQRLAQISLEYARKRKEVEEGPDKQFNLDQIDRQEQMAKLFVTIEDSMKRTQQVFDSVWGNLGSAIDNFVNTGKFKMKDFAASVIRDLIAIEMKAQAMTLLRMLFSSLFPTPMTMTQSQFVSASGGRMFANGGDPPVGKASIVGERGPELFVPRTAGTIIPNHALGGMGGQTINYNGPIIQNMSAIDTQSAVQFLAKNKQAVWSANQSAQRSMPVSR